MLLMGKEGESRARRRLPGSDAVRPRHRRWSCVQRRHHQAANRVVCGGAVVPKRSTTPSGSHSSIPAASPTGDRHDDQADDGILSISCPEVSLGSLRSTGRARSPRQVRGRFRRQIHISKVKGMLRASSRRLCNDSVAGDIPWPPGSYCSPRKAKKCKTKLA